MTSSERDAIGAALGVLGAMAAYPARKELMHRKLDRIARRRGLPDEVRKTIRKGSIAELYMLRQFILGPVDDGTPELNTARRGK